MFGQLSGQEQTHSGLDLSGGDGLTLVVVGETRSLSRDPLEHVVHEGVHDGHALGADAGVRVHLLQDLVDVDRVGFLPLLLAFLAVSSRASGLLASAFLGFLSRYRRHVEIVR